MRNKFKILIILFLVVGIYGYACANDKSMIPLEQKPDLIEIFCIPQQDFEYKYGGTKIGPNGETMDGGKIIPYIILADENRDFKIKGTYSWYTMEFGLDLKKGYTFILIKDEDTNEYKILKILDGKKVEFDLDKLTVK